MRQESPPSSVTGASAEDRLRPDDLAIGGGSATEDIFTGKQIASSCYAWLDRRNLSVVGHCLCTLFQEEMSSLDHTNRTSLRITNCEEKRQILIGSDVAG